MRVAAYSYHDCLAINSRRERITVFLHPSRHITYVMLEEEGQIVPGSCQPGWYRQR